MLPEAVIVQNAASGQCWLFAQKLAEIGMVSGASSPEDDFTLAKRKLERSYDIKVRAILGDELKDDKTVVILHQRLVWKEECIEYEADQDLAVSPSLPTKYASVAGAPIGVRRLPVSGDAPLTVTR